MENLNIRPDTIKFLKENTTETLYNLGLDTMSLK